MATKSSNVVARVEPTIKEQAENILSALGVSASGVINMLYRQIILTNGIPFTMTLPRELPTLDSMTKESFNAMMEESLSQAKEGKGVSLEEAFEILESRA